MAEELWRFVPRGVRTGFEVSEENCPRCLPQATGALHCWWVRVGLSLCSQAMLFCPLAWHAWLPACPAGGHFHDSEALGRGGDPVLGLGCAWTTLRPVHLLGPRWLEPSACVQPGTAGGRSTCSVGTISGHLETSLKTDRSMRGRSGGVHREFTGTCESLSSRSVV